MCKVEKFVEPNPYKQNQRPIYYSENEKGCFICISHRKDRDGYAKLMRNNKEWKAHRYSYTIAIGEIPKGLMVRHLCNNKSCLNPEHLKVGTAKQNSEDWKASNQQKKKPNRLPEEIKRTVALSEKTIPVLAVENNVSHTTISNIRREYRPKKKMKRAPNKTSIPSEKRVTSKKRGSKKQESKK